jgi:hypothetical protein
VLATWYIRSKIADACQGTSGQKKHGKELSQGDTLLVGTTDLFDEAQGSVLFVSRDNEARPHTKTFPRLLSLMVFDSLGCPAVVMM